VKRRGWGLAATVVALLVGQEVMLRAMVDHEVAGALLATGGDPVVLLAAAVGLMLRVGGLVFICTLPAVAVRCWLRAAAPELSRDC